MTDHEVEGYTSDFAEGDLIILEERTHPITPAHVPGSRIYHVVKNRFGKTVDGLLPGSLMVFLADIIERVESATESQGEVIVRFKRFQRTK